MLEMGVFALDIRYFDTFYCKIVEEVLVVPFVL